MAFIRKCARSVTWSAGPRGRVIVLTGACPGPGTACWLSGGRILEGQAPPMRQFDPPGGISFMPPTASAGVRRE
jgi:hypothetical protein